MNQRVGGASTYWVSEPTGSPVICDICGGGLSFVVSDAIHGHLFVLMTFIRLVLMTVRILDSPTCEESGVAFTFSGSCHPLMRQYERHFVNRESNARICSTRESAASYSRMYGIPLQMTFNWQLALTIITTSSSRCPLHELQRHGSSSC